MSEKAAVNKRELTGFIFKTVILFFFIYDVVFKGVPTTFSTRKVSFVVIALWAFVYFVFGRVKKDFFEYPAFRNTYIALGVITAASVPYTLFRARFYEVDGTPWVEYPCAVFFIIYSLIAPVLTAFMFKTREEFQRSMVFVTLAQTVFVLIEYKCTPFKALLMKIVDEEGANVSYESTVRATGLGVSGATTSVMLAFGAWVISLYIIEQLGNIRWMWLCWVAFALTLAAEFLSGRTGFYISLVNLIILLVNVLLKTEEPGKAWRMIGIFFGGFALLFGLWYGFFGRHIYQVRGRLRQVFNLAVEFGSTSEYSFWSKFSGGNIPPLSFDVLFGLGIFRGTTNNDITIKHDSGYVMRLVAEGVPFAVLEYLLLAAVLIFLIRQTDQLRTRISFIILTLILFIIEIKEPYIYKYMPVFYIMTLGLLERSAYLENEQPTFKIGEKKASLGVSMGLSVKRLKRTVKYFSLIRKNDKLIKELIDGENRNLKGKFLTLDDKQKWRTALLGFNRYKPEEAAIIAEHFLGQNIVIEKAVYEPGRIPADEPILLCNVRDDLEKIKNVIAHHRSMGIKYFGILDNGSEDGTYEYLMSENVDVFSVEEQYTSVVRAAWMMKIAAYYGFDRWYVVVDSDELLICPSGKAGNIKEIISALKDAGLKRGLGMMVDMYATESDLMGEASKTGIIESHRYFDTDSYAMKNGTFCPEITGGPRARMFPKAEDEAPELLTKYPVFFWRKGEIYRYHYLYPFEENFDSPLFLALLHYKFADGDYEKLKRIVSEGNYAGGSSLYARYLSRLPEDGRISFMTQSSCELTSPADLLNINVMKRPK